MSLICARFRAAGIGLFSADGWVMAEPGRSRKSAF